MKSVAKVNKKPPVSARLPMEGVLTFGGEPVLAADLRFVENRITQKCVFYYKFLPVGVINLNSDKSTGKLRTKLKLTVYPRKCLV